MRYRLTKSSHFPPFLFIFCLLLSRPEAKNYVILSVTKEGLREVRLAHRGRMVLETSLVAGTSGLAYFRASDKIRLVETVSRDGLIEDCALMEDHGDVTSFVSDFNRVRPDKMLVSESDMLDVYLGHYNLTDPTFLAKHSKKSNPTLTISSVSSTQENSTHVSLGSAERFEVNGSYTLKLTSKITSSETNKMMHKFRRHFRIKKTARECREFYREAKKSLQLLNFLADQPVEAAHAAIRMYLNHTEDGGDAITSQRHPHRQHHHSNQHHHHSQLKDSLSRDGHRPMKSSNQTLGENDDLGIVQLQNGESVHAGADDVTLWDGLSLKTEVNRRAGSDGNFSTAESSLSQYVVDSSNIRSASLQSSKIQSYNVLSTNKQSPDSKLNITEQLTPSLPRDDVNLNNVTAQNESHSVDVRSPHDRGSAQHDDDVNREPAEYMADSPSAHISLRSRSKRDLLTGWMIFPGTKWCGDGDIAENKKDLGYHTELDKCCRRHDLCPLVIPRLSWKYGMFNFRLHTISHCRCDRKFRKCLKSTNSPLAHLIGQIFFNLVGPQCFKFNKETTCLQRFWWGGCREWGESKVAYVKRQRRFK